MSVTHAFLGLLDGGPQHGYRLKQDYDRWFGEGRSLKFGQVYSTLARLERDGMTSVLAVESGDGPDRKRYAITADGVDELESWLDTPVEPDEIGLGPLYAKVVVALLAGRSAEHVLTAQQRVHTERMRSLRAAHRDATLERQLALDFLIGHLQADLDWIELAGSRVSRLGRAGGAS